MVQTNHTNHKHSYYSEKHTHFPQCHSGKAHTLQHCINVCEACSQMCIEEGHKTTASVCRDCADICGLYMKLYSRRSQFVNHLNSVCREILQKCTEECGKMNVEHCKECAEVCQACHKDCFID